MVRDAQGWRTVGGLEYTGEHDDMHGWKAETARKSGDDVEEVAIVPVSLDDRTTFWEEQ